MTQAQAPAVGPHTEPHTEPQAGPLSGYRVLEMGSTVAGPFCGRLLADFGAEVIKIEPAEGDPVRTMGKRFEQKSLYAASIFRNKSLVALDLRKAEGQHIARRIAATCDVVVENFRPGGLEKWGLGYADLSRENPGLVMVRISGFGQTGPYSDRAGYGVIGEAVSGLRHVTGDPDRPPSRIGTSITDYITGLYGAFGAVMALLSRGKSGRGQYIDSALYECAFSFMEPHIPAFQKLGVIANRSGSRLADSTPNNLYVSRDSEFIHITAMGDAVFRRLVECMQLPELATDSRFIDNLGRSQHHEALDQLIGEWTARHDLAELESTLHDAGVPATRIFTMADIFSDPHYAARGSIAHAFDDDLGDVAMATPVPRLSQTPGVIRHAGHRVGQDTRRVLSELLAIRDDDIARLEREGIVSCDRRRTESASEAASERAGAAD